MNKSKLVIAYSFDEACNKENEMVLVTWTDRFFQIIMMVYIVVFRLLHIIWLRVFLRQLLEQIVIDPIRLINDKIC